MPSCSTRSTSATSAVAVNGGGYLGGIGTVNGAVTAAVNGNSEDWTRIVTPGGKIGFVAASSLNALVSDQICYLKDGAGWHIAGIVGGGGQ